MLASQELLFTVLYVFGPGGVGKTTREHYVWDATGLLRTIGLLPEL